MLLPRLTARARLALLSAVVFFVGVLGAVLPFVVEATLRERALELRVVQSALSAAANTMRPDDPLDPLLTSAPLTTLALFGPGDAPPRAAGQANAQIGALFALCAPTQLSGEVRLIESGASLVACARLVNAPELTLVGVTDSPEIHRRRRFTQVTVIAVALASLAAAVSIGAVRRLLSPLSGMAEAARQLARGETQLDLSRPADPELVPLADALRQLAAARNSQLDDIQQRLELTRQLAAIVAHEVRNPLQSLTMLADVVAHEPDPEARRALLRSIQHELGTIETVVQRLLGSGGDLRLVRRATPLDELIHRAIVLLEPSAREAKVKLEVEIAEPLRAEVDSALLRRALENVVRNAVALLGARGGGRVLVRLERHNAQHARVTVDDSGAGVALADRERIFELGVSGRPGGSGLGLPLARMVARAHGGTLEVSESPLGGARFILEVPLTTEPA